MTPERVALLAWGIWGLSWLIAARWSSPVARRAAGVDQARYWALTSTGFLLLLVLHSARFVRASAFWHPAPAAAWSLVGLVVGGFAFMWWARIHLGPLWSGQVTAKHGHRIVETGPYALVRHPIYTGLLWSVFATALLEGTTVAVLGAGLLAAGFWLKARLEERFLAAEFDAGVYAAYARRVPMLIPFTRGARGS